MPETGFVTFIRAWINFYHISNGKLYFRHEFLPYRRLYVITMKPCKFKGRAFSLTGIRPIALKKKESPEMWTFRGFLPFRLHGSLFSWKSQTFANRRCKIHHGSLCFTFRIQAHRRPAGSHRSLCKWVQRGQSVPDPSWCHRLRKDLHDGECHRAVKQADVGHYPQQNPCGAVVW